MTHIAERSTVDPPCHPHPSLDDIRLAIEAVQNLFECAVQWMPWNPTTQDAVDFGDELRADRDAAIRAIRGQA